MEASVLPAVFGLLGLVGGYFFGRWYQRKQQALKDLLGKE